MNRLYIDFETRSKCDLKVKGLANYATDPSTEVLCMAYAFDDEPVKLWVPDEDIVPFRGLNSTEIWAHNSMFEFMIWNRVCVRRYGWYPLDLEQMYCTMSMANAMGFPSSLGQAAQATNLKSTDKEELRKDYLGYRTMMMLSQPKPLKKEVPAYEGPIFFHPAQPAKGGEFWTPEEVPEKFQLLYEYCMRDVEVERGLAKRLAPLSKNERKIWLIDQQINLRGIKIDSDGAKKLDLMVEQEEKSLLEKFTFITGGQVPTVASHAKFKKWLADHGCVVESIAKDQVIKILNEENLHPLVREAIEIRQKASKSSNAKIKAMLNTECNDGRIRNMFAYYGAKQTGRWAGRSVQLQNLPKSKFKIDAINDIFERVSRNAKDEIEILYGNIMDVSSQCIRSLLIPKAGHKFLVADWSNIEGRGLAWLADEKWKIKAFEDFDKGIGHDLYILSYAKSFYVSVDKVNDDQRQIGKTLELACGYQGATGAFQMMAKNLGVKVSDSRAKELVEAWRAAHPKIKQYWYETENAAVEAVNNPGVVYSVGNIYNKIKYIKKGSFLCCELPTGRVMYYPYPKYEKIEAPWGGEKMSITYMYEDTLSKKWVRGPTYGGSLVENNNQGLCREFLAEGLVRLEEANYPVVLHVHDEAGSEVPVSGEQNLKEFERLMAAVPAWAKGFPIAVKGYEGFRYRKG